MVFLLAWFLVYKFAPEASGSGIHQIMAANEMDRLQFTCAKNAKRPRRSDLPPIIKSSK